MPQLDFRAIEEKVQKEWDKEKADVSNPDKREKRFITAAFPYPNSPQHIGHGRTYTITDVHARYLKMKGYNVLFPMAFHVTGTPILAMADRIKAKDKEILDIFENIYHISRKEAEKLTKPEDLVMHFSREIEQGMREMGLMVDWRRKFYSFDPHFNRFIEWQFRKLKEMGHIAQGDHYVPWSVKLSSAVGSHDTKGDVDPQMEEVTAIKFRFKDGFLVVSTYRPETVFGVTNIWVNPKMQYVKARDRKSKEIYYMGEEAAGIIANQLDIEVIGKVDANEMLDGMAKNPANGEDVPIFKASFVKPDVGTGVVMSVPAHAPFDYVALRDIGKENLSKKIIETGAYKGIPAKEAVEKLGIKNQDDERLEEATKALYKEEAHNGRMSVYKPGLPVSKAKEDVKGLFVKEGKAFLLWIIANAPVYTREGDKVLVKKVSGQWFINYGDEKWKAKGREMLNAMSVIPEDGRKEMLATIDWLDRKACTRAKGLGTKFPFDQGQIIESLSDSTIYMAFYTFAHKIREFEPNELDEGFFDYLLLGKGKAKNKKHEEMREEFLYWYPLDSRHTGWDLVKNHLPFFVMNHAAIFDKTMWPRQIVLNGFVLMDGKKMSKSLGNILPLRDAIRKYGADVVRFSVVAGAELAEDTDFSVSMASGIRERMEYILEKLDEKEGKEELIDRWMEAKFSSKLESLDYNFSNFEFRKIALDFFYDFHNDMNWYIARKQGKPKLRKIISRWAQVMAPFMPFVSEYVWRERLGNKASVFASSMPKPEKHDKDVIRAEGIVRLLKEDIERLMGIVKAKPKKIYIYLPDKWKFSLFDYMAETRNFDRIMDGAREKYKDKMEFVAKTAKGLGNRLYAMEKPVPLDVMRKQIEDAKPFLSRQFGCEIIIAGEEGAKHEKARLSTPMKPSIVLE